MKSVFDLATKNDLINRINSLNEKSKAGWGKMNIYQMLKHCTLCEEMYLGKKKYKRSLIGRLFGKQGLKNLLKNETPLPHHSPTNAAFKVRDAAGDVAVEKAKLISLIREYEHYSPDDFEHWFFGKMTKEQLGYFAYRHIDHHLRQFNS